MTQPDPEKLFHAARSMSPETREAYLLEAAQGDPALIDRVLALLNSDEEAGSFLGAADSPDTPVQAAETEGDWIGRFRLLQQIGEGGMGTVWMAEQVEPYRRKVALKVIKLGMDTKEVVVRFEAERQALALMDHPHIARVIDGGATTTGRPYFVMELVRGVPITEYCNKAKLGLRERLELFSKVCDAVQHAHQKGVIHRDIKPSNVMVTLHDGMPVPKVIDFGIAKATSAELTQKTLFTQYSQIVGTPEYMAPEQAEMSGLDIDTRADVYSLGVLLYELLTGTKPFDLHKALEVGYMELLRTIREVDPQRPSTRVSTLDEKASILAMNQHANVESLSKRLRGELDWIVMKALEKDRTRRYETANGFAADIARFLADTPVTAVPPSAGYQLRKFVHRNRGRVIAAGLLVGAVVLGLVGTTTGLLWAVEEKQAAEVAREQALQAKADAETEKTNAIAARSDADAARERAEQARGAAELAEAQTKLELARANEVKKLITDMLDGASPAIARGADTALLEEILQGTGKRLMDGEIKDERIAGELHSVLAGVLTSLAKWESADKHATLAYDLRSQHLSPDDPEMIGDVWAMAHVHRRAGRTEQAIEFARRTVEGYRQLSKVDRVELVHLGGALNSLAEILIEAGNVAEAETAMKEAIEVQTEYLGKVNPIAAGLLRNLAVLYEDKGQIEKAETLHAEALKIDALYPDFENPIAFQGLYVTANFYFGQERLAEAEELLLKALAGQERILPSDHESLGQTRELLALVYTRTNRTDLIEEKLGKQFLGRLTISPESSEDELGKLANRAVAKSQQGKHEEAYRELQQIRAVLLKRFGEEHGLSGMVRHNLISNLEFLGRMEEAAALMLIDYETTLAQRGPNHRATRDGLRHLGLSYYKAKQFDKAEAAYLDVLQRDASLGKQDTKDSLGTLTNLGLMYSETGRIAEAIEYTERSLAAKRRVLKPLDPYKSSAMYVLIDCYRASGRTADLQALEKELTQMGAQLLASRTEEPNELLKIARHLVTLEELHTRSPKLALEIMDNVASSREHNPYTQALILEVRALAQFELGLIDEAIAASEQGLDVLPEAGNRVLRKRLQAGLDRYRSADQD